MKVGDLVKWNKAVCVVAETYESRCWRSEVDGQYGAAVNWSKIEKEPFARIYFKGSIRGVPQTDLEVMNVK
jgi:hypothetical protein